MGINNFFILVMNDFIKQYNELFSYSDLRKYIQHQIKSYITYK